MPLFHVHGLIGALLSTFHSSGSVVLPLRFSATTFWTDIAQYHCSWVTAVSTIHQMVYNRYRHTFPTKNNLRFIRSCSSALAPSHIHQMETYYKLPVVEAYAMTEVCL